MEVTCRPCRMCVDEACSVPLHVQLILERLGVLSQVSGCSDRPSRPGFPHPCEEAAGLKGPCRRRGQNLTQGSFTSPDAPNPPDDQSKSTTNQDWSLLTHGPCGDINLGA